jgi:hypothetical protein
MNIRGKRPSGSQCKRPLQCKGQTRDCGDASLSGAQPGSGRAYTIVRLRTQSGLTGWGEAAKVSAPDVERARSRIVGKPATAYGVTSTDTP